MLTLTLKVMDFFGVREKFETVQYDSSFIRKIKNKLWLLRFVNALYKVDWLLQF